MIDREHEELLNEVVGGDAPPEDVARLEVWLASSAEGRQRRRELEALFAALAAVPRVPPPASLRDNVLATIRTRMHSAGARARRGPTRAWFLVPVAAAAVAVAIAFPGLRQALRPNSLPDVSGSMAGRSPASPARTILSVGGSRVAMSTTAGTRGTIVSFDAATNTPLAIEFEADPATLARATVIGLAPAAVRLDVAHGRLGLALDGATRFALIFRPALRRDESVKVAVQAGERRAEGVLPQPGEER